MWCVLVWVLQEAYVKMVLDIQESYCGGNGKEPSDANSADSMKEAESKIQESS